MASEFPPETPSRYEAHVPKLTEAEPKEALVRLLQSVVIHAKDAIVITEAEPRDQPGPRVIYVNNAFCQMTGYAREEIISKTPRILQGPKTDRATLDRIRKGLLAWEHVQEEVINYRKDGSEFWLELSIVPVADETGWYTHWIAIERDITERKRILQQVQTQHALLEAKQDELEEAYSKLAQANLLLTEQAATDGLTGLKNHRAFQERIAQEFERSRRYNLPFSLILLDVDKFKSFNDTFGHPAGDKVLRQVADTLNATARITDTTARYGGEEFAVLLPMASEADAEAGAERIRAALENAEWPQRQITASLGIATFTPQMVDAAQLLAKADEALYYSKQNGRNRATHYSKMPKIAASLENYNDLIKKILTEYDDTLTPSSERIREALIQGYAAIEGLSRALDLRDHETEGHSVRVTEMTVKVARDIGFTEEEILYARWGALLHDIGKMGIPDSILLKPGKLTDEEWVIMKLHPKIAYDMLAPVDFLRPALDIPYYHHEKWDGTGYPHGLKGDAIPVAARIFAVIDVWDALSSDRPYRKAWSKREVITHLRSLSGTHFDPLALQAFLLAIGEPDEAESERPRWKEAA